MFKTLAIFSPAQNVYSETFIQAHRKLPFIIRYYYDGYLPRRLEGLESLQHFNIAQRIKKKFDKRFDLFETALLQSLKKEKVDCILAEYGPTACWSLNVLTFLQLPLIVHFHGYDASVKTLLEEYADGYKKVFAYAAAIVVVSGKMKESLIALGCPEEKLVMAVYGPDNIFFKIQPDYEQQQFIAVGRFVEKKGHALTIAAFREVVNVYPGAKLILVGDGELLESCKSATSALGLENNIEFRGVKSREDILLLFKESIAFVQHSLTAANGDCEGTPVAILEAQASALPVISTYHAGIPDVVVNNETGLLTEEQDVQGMSNNMIRLLKEQGLAKKLGQKGRENMQLHFTLERHLQTITDTVNAAITQQAVN